MSDVGMNNINSIYQYVFIYIFFNKHYSSFILNNDVNYGYTEQDIFFFKDFFNEIISIYKDENNIMSYIKSKYEKNKYLKKIINLYMMTIIEILKYEYLNTIIRKFYIDNSINVIDSFKIFKIHMSESFKKDNIELKNINISINIHNEYNKFYIKDANNFIKIVNDYYDIKFNDMIILFNIFVKSIELRKYCKNLINFIDYIITPNLQNSV